MSALPAISIRGLSKTFALHTRKAQATFGPQLQSLSYLVRNVLAQGRGPAKPPPKKKEKKERLIHALRDIDLDLQPGQVVGIIGRNGAGKSTLLKILARVLDPTEGKIVIRGRLVGLLELGMGFIPDRTLSENIQLHAHLAGLGRREAREAEDRILRFAELEAFRDELLKNAPSGSFIRLAFAALINMDADVILADEVLAAGDAAFRETCEERICEAGKAGRTVLLVSHDMRAIRRICSRTVWIDAGRIKMDGPVEEVVQAYEAELLPANSAARLADGPAVSIIDLRLLDGDGHAIGAAQMQSAFSVECIFRLCWPEAPVRVVVELWAASNLIASLTCPKRFDAQEPKTFRASVRLPEDFLNEATYTARCKLLLGDGEQAAVAEQRDLEWNVYNAAPERSVWSDWRFNKTSLVAPRLEWTRLPQTEEA